MTNNNFMVQSDIRQTVFERTSMPSARSASWLVSLQEEFRFVWQVRNTKGSRLHLQALIHVFKLARLIESEKAWIDLRSYAKRLLFNSRYSL